MVEKGGRPSNGAAELLDKWAEDSNYVLGSQALDDTFRIEDELMVGEIDSTKVDHESLVSTLNHIQNCISHVQQNVNNVKVAAKQSKRHTFGNNATSDALLSDKDREQIE